MKKIESLINKVELIRQKSEEISLKSYNKGERFDVFSVVGYWDEEVNLHSAIIAELLDPHGSHGAGDIYLKEFLVNMGCKDSFIDSNNVKHHNERNITERNIGPKTDATGGRIDIIIEDGKHALIIENKPGNEDQENQMLRYHTYAQSYEECILIYLTKDGREASDKSTGGKRFEYKCLSYSDIISWLENCSKKSSNRNNVKAIINQYLFHLKKILGQTMDEINKQKLLALLTNKNNALAVKEILCNGDLWLNSIIEEYLFMPLGKYAESKNMKYESSSESGGCGFYMYNPSWKYYGIFLWSDKRTWSDIYVGVSWFEEPKRENRIFKKDFLKMGCLTETPIDVLPYGWESLPAEFNYFSYDNADRIIKGEVYGWVKQKFDEMLNEISTSNLRMP